jgi:hypothetical protein
LFSIAWAIKFLVASNISTGGSSAVKRLSKLKNKVKPDGSLELTPPIPNQADAYASIVIGWRVSTMHVKAPTLIHPSITADSKVVANVVPFSIILMKRLHPLHSFDAGLVGVTGCWLVRMMNDDKRDGAFDVDYIFGGFGTPIVTGYYGEHVWMGENWTFSFKFIWLFTLVEIYVMYTENIEQTKYSELDGIVCMNVVRIV